VVAAKPQRAAAARPAAAAHSISHDDLPELKPRRPRWQLPLGVAAALALGVVGLRQLDHAPTPTPAELAHPVNASNAAAKALQAAPKSDEGDDDDDDGQDPNVGNDPTPEPTTPDPEPLKAKAAAAQAKPAAAPAPATGASAAEPAAADSAAAPPQSGATGAAAGSVHINVDSDPPGARLFWKGKEVGTTPFVLELQPGEKHAYELGLPGYTTRKVVIDGSKTDITIGLRPDPAPPVGLSQRK
jgi:PEGA domain